MSEEEVSATPEPSQVDKCFAMSPDEFNALKAADKQLAMFLMLRELASGMFTLQYKVQEVESKARELMTPGGIQKLMDQFMGDAMSGGGLMKSLMSGKGLF